MEAEVFGCMRCGQVRLYAPQSEGPSGQAAALHQAVGDDHEWALVGKVLLQMSYVPGQGLGPTWYQP
jgi:hypothetical protein